MTRSRQPSRLIPALRRRLRSIGGAVVPSLADERGEPRLRWVLVRGCAFAFAVVGVGLLAGACGGSPSPGVASARSNSTTTTEAPATASPSSSAALYEDELKYSRCMQTHGVPNFPDPSAGGGFRFGAGINPSSPAFDEAQAKCEKLMPGGGVGSGAPPTAQALAQMLKVSRCMRRHGISDFPDPRTSVPSNRNPAVIGEIADRDGVILLFPRTLDTQSPAFVKAAAACGFALTNH